ncbi:hypothetical protein ACET3Z_027557 [Daucus carota]
MGTRGDDGERGWWYSLGKIVNRYIYPRDGEFIYFEEDFFKYSESLLSFEGSIPVNWCADEDVDSEDEGESIEDFKYDPEESITDSEDIEESSEADNGECRDDSANSTKPDNAVGIFGSGSRGYHLSKFLLRNSFNSEQDSKDHLPRLVAGSPKILNKSGESLSRPCSATFRNNKMISRDGLPPALPELVLETAWENDWSFSRWLDGRRYYLSMHAYFNKNLLHGFSRKQAGLFHTIKDYFITDRLMTTCSDGISLAFKYRRE